MIKNKKYNTYLSKGDPGIDVQFANYHTSYVYGTDPDVVFNQNTTEDIFKLSYACFGNFFGVLRNKGKRGFKNEVVFDVGKPLYISVVFCLSTRALNSHGSNICIVDNVEDITRFVNNFEDIINYHADVIIENDLCRVNIIINSVSENGLKEMFLLTWIRYLYELPYSLLALDMFKLSKMDKYNKEDLMNLYTLVSHISGREFSSGHSCIQYGKFQTREEFSTKLNSKSTLNTLYDAYRSANFIAELSKPRTNLNKGRCHILNIKDAFDDEKFEERCKIYERLYDHLAEVSNYKKEGNT